MLIASKEKHFMSEGVCWLGNNGWLIKNHDFMFSTDLILDDPLRIQSSPLSVTDIAEQLKIHFVTHEHADHFHDQTCVALAEQSECIFVIPKSCTEKAHQLQLPLDRIKIVEPDQHYCLRGLNFRTTRAVHGHIHGSIYKGASLWDCGYIFDLDGLQIFQPGDTVLLQEHQEDIQDIDVMFVSPTEHNTGIVQSAEAISCIQPKRIFAQHFGTFHVTDENRFWTVGYPDQLLQKLTDPYRKFYTVPEQGIWYSLHPNTVSSRT